jgi:hypothetical protein
MAGGIFFQPPKKKRSALMTWKYLINEL